MANNVMLISILVGILAYLVICPTIVESDDDIDFEE